MVKSHQLKKSTTKLLHTQKWMEIASLFEKLKDEKYFLKSVGDGGENNS